MQTNAISNYYRGSSPINVSKESTQTEQTFESIEEVFGHLMQESINEENTEQERERYFYAKTKLVMAEFAAGVQEAMKIQGLTDTKGLDWQLVADIRKRNFYQKDDQVDERLQTYIDIISDPNIFQRGSYMGQTESPEHFEKRKSQAIDILSEILQGIKA